MATSCLSEISVHGDRRLAEEEGAGKRDADSDSKGRFGILADLQVFVTNLSIRKDRKAHMERMLHALGLRNISFPPLIPAEMVDIFPLFSESADDRRRRQDSARYRARPSRAVDRRSAFSG